MRTFAVEYSNERGASVRRTFTDEAEAIAAFLRYFPESEPGVFPVADSWPMIGWETEDTASFGYVQPIGYDRETGHQTAAIAYTEVPTCRYCGFVLGVTKYGIILPCPACQD